MLKLIPFNSEWMTHETLDLHAVYRRPQRTFEGDIVRDAYGFPQWDLTTPLPVRKHYIFLAKGFQYVTLFKADDVINASDPELSKSGVTPIGNPQQYLGQARDRGPWDAQQYLRDMKAERDEQIQKLEDRIARMGPDAAEEVEQANDPGYVLPAKLAQPGPVVEDKPKRGRPRKEAVAV